MTGIDRDGLAVSHSRRQGRPVPTGRLTPKQVADGQELLARGARAMGYTTSQIGQLLGTCPRTIYSRLHAAPHNPAPRPC